MKLTGEQFQQIIAQLTSDTRDKHHDKRKEPRVGIRAKGLITPHLKDGRDTRPLNVTIRDLSPSGICVIAPVPLLKSSTFTLKLVRLEETMLLANFEVRHCKLLAEGMYSVGAHLLSLAECTGEAAAA
jgi:hypothetical protein